MKSFKGSAKQFAQYLNSEYHDSVLELLESKVSDINKLIEHNCFKEPVEQDDIDIQEIYKKKDYKTVDKFPRKLFKARLECSLTKEYLKQATFILGSDAKKCYSGLFEFRYLTQKEPYLPYKQIYHKLDAVPMLFLSISRSEKNNREIEAVYLWQINRDAPYGITLKWENYTPTDITEVKKDMRLHSCPSMLLLGKIVPENGESIISANLVGESKLVVRSVKEDSSEVIMRLYSVTRLFDGMRINPYKYQVIANENYSFAMRINFKKSEENLELVANLWKRSTLEEMDLTSIPEDKEVPNNSMPDEQLTSSIRLVHSDMLVSSHNLVLKNDKDLDIKSFFRTVPCSVNDWMLFVNNMNSTFLLWNEEALQLVKSTEAIHSIQEFNSRYYLLDQCGQFHQLAFDEKGKWTLDMINCKISFPIASGFEFQVIELNNQMESRKVTHLVYFYQNKFHAISLEENTPIFKILLDLENKIEDGKQLPWTIYSILPIAVDDTDTVVIAFYSKGWVYLHDIATDRKNAISVFTQDQQLVENNWQLTASNNGTLYLHDLRIKNLLVSIYHRFDKDELFTKDYSKDISFSFLPKANAETKEDCTIKFGGCRDGIVLIPRENEPYYEDMINKIYPRQESIQVLQIEKPKRISKDKQDSVEVSEEDKEAALLEKLWHSKRQIANSKNKEFVLEESQKALVALRDNISGSMQKIWKYKQEMKKYHRDLEEYNLDTDYYKKYRPIDVPKGVNTVSKDSLALYAQMKQEKKRVKKQNEKEKEKNKKERRNLFL